jgi:GNAT superfamily N-acetyltransferase
MAGPNTLRVSRVQDESTPAQLRLATVADADSIAALLLASFAGYRHLYTAAAFAATTPTAATLTARLVEGPTWLASIDQEIAGTVSAWSDATECHIRSMAVHPAHRGRGLARLLLDAAEQWAITRECRRITLETTSFLNDAIRLYRAGGFTFTGAERDLFGTPVLEMEKRLPAVSS